MSSRYPALISRRVLIACPLLASAACQQNEIGMPEVVRIAEKRLSSETGAYRCKEVNYESYRLDPSERGRRIADTKKKGDHALYCEPSRAGEKDGWIIADGQKIVFVSKYGVFQY
jgi:hypothetical protein